MARARPGGGRVRAAVKEVLGDNVAAQPFDALVNRGMEERSRVLWLVKPEDRDRFLALGKAAAKPKPGDGCPGSRRPAARHAKRLPPPCWMRRMTRQD